MKSVPYTVEDAERRFTEDFPNWELELIKCPPGELYYDKMKPFTRARDLDEKYGNKPAKEWGRTKDRGLYVNRTGEMGEVLVKLVIEHQMRGNPGLLLSGFRLMDFLAKKGKNERDETVVPTIQNLGVGCLTDPNTNQATKLGSIEHDLAFWRLHGDFLEAGFVQVKTIEVPTEKKHQGQGQRSSAANCQRL